MESRGSRAVAETTPSVRERVSALIDRVVPGPVATYKIKEWDGTPVKGTFYEQDVQKVDVPDDALFRVEKVLQRRRHEVKVRWKGWPRKYDCWIPKRSLASLQ